MQVTNLAALAACLFAVSSSIAAPFPSSNSTAMGARTASRDTIVSYQEYSEKEKCQIKGLCVLTFPAVTDSQVLVQHISCTFGIKTGGTFVAALLGSNGQKDFSTLSASKTAVSTPPGDLYTIGAQMYFFVPAGDTPEVTVVSENKNAENLRCTVSGQRNPQPA